MSGLFRDSDELTNAVMEHIKTIIEAEPTTNGDRFREMTDEELAAYLSGSSCTPNANIETCRARRGDCYLCWLMWLRKPAGDY